MNYGTFGKIDTGSKILDLVIWLFCAGFIVSFICWVLSMIAELIRWICESIEARRIAKDRKAHPEKYVHERVEDPFNTKDLFGMLDKMTKERNAKDTERMRDLLEKVCNKRMTLYQEDRAFLERMTGMSINEIEKYSYEGINEETKKCILKLRK